MVDQRDQHVRRMRSSIVSVIHYVSPGLLRITDLMPGSATCPLFSAKKKRLF